MPMGHGPSGQAAGLVHGEIKTPPFSGPARIEAGVLLRRLQRDESLGLPHSRPMPVIGRRCHELRLPDKTKNWRFFYHTAVDAIVILDIHEIQTQHTLLETIRACQRAID